MTLASIHNGIVLGDQDRIIMQLDELKKLNDLLRTQINESCKVFDKKDFSLSWKDSLMLSLSKAWLSRLLFDIFSGELSGMLNLFKKVI